VLVSGTQVSGLKPGRSRRIFKDGKILSTPSFGREVKPWVPCRRFAAFKRSLKCTVEVGILGKIPGPHSPPISSNFRRQSAERVNRRGASGGQSWNVQSGRYNKPAGCSTSVACRGRPSKQTNRGGKCLLRGTDWAFKNKMY
jgi:hypothetical protein